MKHFMTVVDTDIGKTVHKKGEKITGISVYIEGGQIPEFAANLTVEYVKGRKKPVVSIHVSKKVTYKLVRK